MTSMLTTTPPFTVSISVTGTAADIWLALTDRDKMVHWYFPQLLAFEAEVGFSTEFALTNDDKSFTHQWKVSEVVSHKKISYEWTFAEYPGKSVSIFEIIETDSGNEVAVTTQVLEDFPTDIPEFTVESGTGGWEYLLGQLAEYLDK